MIVVVAAINVGDADPQVVNLQDAFSVLLKCQAIHLLSRPTSRLGELQKLTKLTARQFMWGAGREEV